MNKKIYFLYYIKSDLKNICNNFWVEVASIYFLNFDSCTPTKLEFSNLEWWQYVLTFTDFSAVYYSYFRGHHEPLPDKRGFILNDLYQWHMMPGPLDVFFETVKFPWIFSLNSANQWLKISIIERIWTCHLLHKIPGWYHSTSKTQLRDRIFKFAPPPQFMRQWFIRFPEFAEFTEFPFHSGKTLLPVSPFPENWICAEVYVIVNHSAAGNLLSWENFLFSEFPRDIIVWMWTDFIVTIDHHN